MTTIRIHVQHDNAHQVDKRREMRFSVYDLAAPAPGTFLLSRRGPRSGAAARTGSTTLTAIESKLSERRRAWALGMSTSKVVQKDETHLGVAVDLETRDAGVEGRNLGNVVVLPLPLLLLELEGDTADGTLLDALHQVSGEAGDLVTQTLRRDDSLCTKTRGHDEWMYDDRGMGGTDDFIDDPLVGVEVEGEAGVAAMRISR